MDREKGFLILQMWIILWTISFYISTENIQYLIVGLVVFVVNSVAKYTLQRQRKEDENLDDSIKFHVKESEGGK